MAGDSRSRSRSVSFREEATPTSYSKFAIDRVPAMETLLMGTFLFETLCEREYSYTNI
jgi:hypothetical protein